MNKRFKRSGFDERIIGYAEDLVDMCCQLFKVNITAVRENGYAIINRRDHEYYRPESAVEACVIHNFF